jgi:isopentenyl-diphosphate delta-isomerase
MTIEKHVILVDEHDRETGTAEKLEAHQENRLHRAFSIFIFNKNNQLELLLQQRAFTKYHCPGLWTNTCCSHPSPGESVVAAGERRLLEELGFATPLKQLSWFHYNAHFLNGLSENEIDHVLIGFVADKNIVKPNPDEIHAYRWITPDALKVEMHANPAQFTPWLAQALEIALNKLA